MTLEEWIDMQSVHINMEPHNRQPLQSWSCELEQDAIKALGNDCPSTEPANPSDKAVIFSTDYWQGEDPLTIIQSSLNSYLEQIDNKKLDVLTLGTVSSNPIFTGTDNLLRGYANLVRATNTEIGCAVNICPTTPADPTGRSSLYCILNGKNIQPNEPIYQGTTKITDGCNEVTCPTGYACNNATLICAPGAATTTPPTTSSTISSTSASTSSPTSPTTAPPAATTVTPSPQAQFPTGGGNGGRCSGYANSNWMTDALRDEYLRLHNVRRGLLARGETARQDGKYLPKAANMWKMFYVQQEAPSGSIQTLGGGSGGRCSGYANSNWMTDALRDEYLRLHNVRRGLLARGETARQDGKYLPKAANMWKMKYMCDLEEGAIAYASTCPTSLSEPSSRPGLGENLKTFPATRFTFDTAPKKSVTEWWKVIRSVNYFEKVVVFRPFHDGQPISSFTQVGGMLAKTRPPLQGCFMFCAEAAISQPSMMSSTSLEMLQMH
ncbi:hypothetical protein Y032_0095g2855 [Ancylostoma ceylanicum]|uniref:SCP domain-containing protein n=1 Tax=Ancylostoma ceylanicum TaxID=53326 RepID=A0A016TKW1_9BILA|nr:hypothetical protein Y032_0095g2855 [Ancylostoma ceylanicum]